MDRAQAIDLDRERSVGEILGSALDLYRAYPLLFLTLAVVVMAPYDLVVLAATGQGPLGQAHERFATALLVQILGFSLVGPLISALHVHALVEIGKGSRPRLAAVAVSGLLVLPVVSAAEIVANIGIALGLLALILPGVLLALRWAVVAQVAAVEHEGWIPALRRSGALTAGCYWHILGLSVITGGLAFAIRRVLGAVALGSSSSSVMLGIALDTILASFTALTLAILYFDLRARESDPGRRRIPEYQHLHDLD
ncbi:MAG TPA: hypothetical protein VGF15_01790 [Solirubrobacteraceae bacterium]